MKMIAALLVLAAALQAVAPGSVPAQTPSATAQTQPGSQANPKSTAEVDAAYLAKVKRIYVDGFGEDAISKEIQSMIVSSLVKTKRFKVTEEKDKADAILRGVALEKTSQEVHAYGESTTVAGASGAQHSQVSGSVQNGNGSISGSSSGGFVAHHLATDDSSVNTETVNDARVAIRLVTPEGDVFWTSTQESKGAKYLGASADVAEKCVKQLVKDAERIERAGAAPQAGPEEHKNADQH